MTTKCGAVSGSSICQRDAHTEDTKHEDTGTYWGPGEILAAPFQVFHCTGCGETFDGGSIADEPCMACSCIDKDNGGNHSGRLRNGPNGLEEMPIGPPHWIVYEGVRELDEAGVSDLLKRVGYMYPRPVE